ncbi:CRISPR-associated helicase Cas3' [Frankia sp. CiP1_Cm_nod1]|uniref:CRISPR-associated helicase Cas3' n=1 Tax=Frankia sp. CiP1_Cm_nod1 TaxID=2897160 RepID=UPI00202505B8
MRDAADAAIAVVWGKSDAQGSMHLLLGHLLDTAAVGELVWDRFLSTAIRGRLDECSGGRGRSLFALLCGLHDVGKATPAFQTKDDGLAERVRAAGLDWRGLTRSQAAGWHHARAGAVIVRDCLKEAGWGAPARNWVWPLVAGHHGKVPGTDRLRPTSPTAHGRGRWLDVQQEFVGRVAGELGLDLDAFSDVATPRRGGQLTLSGMIIMADWVASDARHFDGLSDLSDISIEKSRDRAQRAWDKLGLRGGWRADRPAPRDQPDLVRHRFGVAARPAQADAVRLAARMPTPGLLILEAPMGEGKTEAAFAAVEVLASRFGADGMFVGMPTQATSDPMFGRVRTWLTSVDPDVPIGLLHGRARFNKEWAALRSAVAFTDIADERDEYDMDDDYGFIGSGGTGSGSAAGDGGRPAVSGTAAAEWFLGPKRGLLAPVTVGTVDQLLHAATRTKHVMLRQAGTAGRVVVLDEVHAYDVYMAQFLFEALRWLADTGVPVVLLSATLPPSLRLQLVRAYLQGALQERDVDVTDLPVPAGYPSATAVCVTTEGKRWDEVASGPSWRASARVEVRVLAETPDFSPAAVAAAVTAEVGDGGCALVVCNTVARAQDVHTALRPAFGEDVVLLHARFVGAERAARAERVVDLLGRPGRPAGAARPRRLVVVATQVAEQSFDVDVDLLVTDLAPIDLLLQRVGRLHRHDRPATERPPGLRQPRVIVSGLLLRPGAVPTWPGGSRAVYGDHLLLRSAALVADAAAGDGWSVPADVPGLVAAGYGEDPLGPPEWAENAAQARREWAEREQRREANAREFLLSGEDNLGCPTLAGLHERSTAPLSDEEKVAAVVRDGEESMEVVLVRQGSAGYLTLGGRALGPSGETAVSDDTILEEVVGATIRLPANKEITTAARAGLAPLPAWLHDPWLRRARALVLDENLSVALGTYRLTYNDEVGLRHERGGTR